MTDPEPQEESAEEKPAPAEMHPVLKAFQTTNRSLVVGCTCDSWMRWWARGFLGMIFVPEILGYQEIETPFGPAKTPRLGPHKPLCFFINPNRGDQAVVLPDSSNISRSTIRISFCPFCGSGLDLDTVYTVRPVAFTYDGSHDDANT
jgi:hypothetical protein